MKQKLLFLSVVFSLTLTWAFADEPANSNNSNDPIVVTAARSPSSVLKDGKSITVITEDDIKNSGKKSLADILKSAIGLTVTRNGTDGGIANVYIRGGMRSNVLIMIDGVRINDPMGIGKQYDISAIDSSNIEHIEIVRGAMSSMYGAEASGGVINIITKKTGRGVSLSGEGGSDKSLRGTVSAGGSAGSTSAFFSASRYMTEGISKAKRSAAVSSYDDDAYSNTTVSGRLNSDVSKSASLAFSMNYTDSKVALDDGAFEDDPNHVYSSRLFTSRGEFAHTPFAWLNYKAGLSYMSYERDDTDRADSADTDENDFYLYNGSNVTADFICVFNILKADSITLGAEFLDERGSSSSSYYNAWALPPGFENQIFKEKSAFTGAVFAHNALSAGAFSLNAGARLDRHSKFGTYGSWDASASVKVPVIKTVLRTSAGTGFRAPSLYELYSPSYGNSELEPEESFTYDAGIYQELFKGIVSLDASLFRQRYKSIIAYGTLRYENAGRARNSGAEISASLSPFSFLSFTYGCVLLKYGEGASALKRPRYTHTASALVSAGPVNFMFMYFYAGRRADVYYNSITGTSENKRLDQYHKLDLNVRWALNDSFTFSLRCENILDADYEESYGYNTKGRTVYGGVEARL